MNLYAQACPDPCYIWQGGEPTLYPLDDYRRLMAFQRGIHSVSAQAENIIQTHGLNLTEEWLDFLQEYEWAVGLSYDGEDGAGREWTNEKRDAIHRAAHGMRERSIPHTLVCTVDEGNVYSARETVADLADICRMIQFIPRRATAFGEELDISAEPDAYARFIEAARDEAPRLGAYLVNDGQAFDAWTGQLTTCEVAPQCGDYMVVESNGDLYPCDFHVTDDWCLGNIDDVSDLGKLYETHPRYRRFRELKQLGHPDCDECEVRPACNRGCPYDRASKRRFYGDKTPWCASLMDCAKVTRP